MVSELLAKVKKVDQVGVEPQHDALRAIFSMIGFIFSRAYAKRFFFFFTLKTTFNIEPTGRRLFYYYFFTVGTMSEEDGQIRK